MPDEPPLVVTVSSDWLRTVLKKAKMQWPKELVEHAAEDDDDPECPVAEDGEHVPSRHSTHSFCRACGETL